MKLFLDRNKTLLPRVDIIYLLTRLMTLLGISWFAFYGDYRPEESFLFYIMIGTFALHLGVFFAAIKERFNIRLAYLSAIIYDIIMIPTLILLTGGLHSPFFMLFLLTISVAVYVLTFWFAASVSAIVTLGYLGSVFHQMSLESIFEVSIRIGFMLVYYLAISYASDYMRRSERRMLKLFDTLNMRTAELEKSQTRLEMIYEHSRVLAAILDTDGVVKELIAILETTMQYSHYGMISNDHKGNLYLLASSISGRKNFHPIAIERGTQELVRRVCEAGEPIRLKDVSARNDYSPLSPRTKSAMVVPLVSHGQINGVLIAESGELDYFIDRDIQLLSIVARSAALALENAELHKRTEELTVIDALTDTFNYRYFVRKLQEEKRRATRYNLPLSLIMVDIDYFKKLNDTYGHEAGNLVLADMSAIIKTCIRDVDIFSRYGGEEFIVILPQTAQGEARLIAERIRSRVEQTKFRIDKNTQLSSTVSVGVSSFPENGHSGEELVTITDQAMYKAKEDGRNLVRVK